MDVNRLVVIIVVFIMHQSHGGRIKLDDDRGYIDMVIAIRNVPEDTALLDAIKREFTLASSHLHTATRQMTYFKNIRILVPPTWSDSDQYEEITWESYQAADVLIKPSTKHVPYVRSYGTCGRPGVHMVLTPEFIKDREHGQGYGMPQKTLIHEFGHLRWGLKDEYAYDNDNSGGYHHFYQNEITGKIEGTRCVEAIKGDINIRGTNTPCKSKSEDGLWDVEKCIFYDDRSANNYSASLMYNQHISHVSEFCDSANGLDGGIRHNINAPNRQNVLCNFKSSWEVMREHSDFSGQPRSTSFGELSFKIIKEVDNTTTVFVLDTSGSMAGERLADLRKAAGIAISDVLPLGSRVGMVRFSSYSSQLSSIVTISTKEDRDTLTGLLPIFANGATSIGSGIRRAVQMLRSDTARTMRRIIVVSDGEENTAPYISDVMDEVMEANVTVDTIAIGSTVDRSFEDLASATNGQSFVNSEGLASLYLSFFQSIRGAEQSENAAGAPFILETSSHAFQFESSNFNNSFYIDEALTGDLKLIISYNIYRTFNGNAKLVDPQGVVYDITSEFFSDETDLSQGIFNINQRNVQVGMWDLTVDNTGLYENYEVIVQATVSNSDKLLTATVSWALAKLEPPQRQILYVAVSRDLTPVINAKVVAIISASALAGIDQTTVHPVDNGAGADSLKDDGVYSIYFTQFTSTGRYGVQVLVEGTPNTQLVEGAFLGGGSGPRDVQPGEDVAPEEIVYEPTGLFQREVLGQTFVCEGQACIDASTMDLYPPTEIMDLAATNVHPENNTFTLTFTAPGDDLSDGTASAYEFRYSFDFSDLVYRFNETEVVPEDWFILGNTSAPQEAGSKETFILQVVRIGNVTYNIAVVALDDEMNRSQRSNIARSSGSLLFLQSGGLSIGVIVGIVAAVLLIVFIVIAVCVACKGKGKNPPITPQV